MFSSGFLGTWKTCFSDSLSLTCSFHGNQIDMKFIFSLFWEHFSDLFLINHECPKEIKSGWKLPWVRKRKKTTFSFELFPDCYQQELDLPDQINRVLEGISSSHRLKVTIFWPLLIKAGQMSPLPWQEGHFISAKGVLVYHAELSIWRLFWYSTVRHSTSFC